MRKLLLGWVIGAAMFSGVQVAQAHWPTKGQDIAVVDCILHPELYFKSHCDDHWHALSNQLPYGHP